MTTAKKVETTKKVDLMYVGPTIAGVTRHSTVYKNGILPDKLAKCIEDFPAMNRLLVKLEDLPATMNELRKEQSALKTIYSQTQTRFIKEV